MRSRLLLALALGFSISVAVPSVAVQTQQNATVATVYATKTGSKYHADGCRYLRQSKIALKLSEAIKRGLSACSVCRP